MEAKSVSASGSFFNKGVANKGFVNFMRSYSRQNYGLDVVAISVQGSKAWNKLTYKQKDKYRTLDLARNAMSEMYTDACCPMRRKSKPCCPKPRKRKPCCPPPKPRCPVRRCRPCCRPKCSKPKPRCCKPKPRCCKPKPRCCKPKPRCCKRKPRCCKPANPCARRKCRKPVIAPLTNNGYLNFMNLFRRKYDHLEPKDLVVKGAKAWCRMSEYKKDRFRRQSRTALTL
ncbi:histone-like protein 18C [Drosophila montana]|uniref:histone-like protein 18C n=1 Tax=Drosophila montana TaxID=40370 RepID=UPI00313B681E